MENEGIAIHIEMSNWSMLLHIIIDIIIKHLHQCGAIEMVCKPNNHFSKYFYRVLIFRMFIPRFFKYFNDI